MVEPVGRKAYGSQKLREVDGTRNAGYRTGQPLFIGSRLSDHYFRSVCLSVCAEFFSAVFDPILIKRGHMLYVWV